MHRLLIVILAITLMQGCISVDDSISASRNKLNGELYIHLTLGTGKYTRNIHSPIVSEDTVSYDITIDAAAPTIADKAFFIIEYRGHKKRQIKIDSGTINIELLDQCQITIDIQPFEPWHKIINGVHKLNDCV
ncbi:MAG: hypothetical protein HRT35_27820 [Algicola sp.]|nr:hypothetical protein [Algicola sp.]